jgi:large subunit ribosomal protein L4
MAETHIVKAPAYTSQGTSRDAVMLPEALFDGTINEPVMHQVVKAYLANQRQGTASTKIRKYVTGGNQKPWRQKGTGRARQGSTRAPQWVGGGTVFGPTPRSYRQDLPKQVRALGRKSAFNARARENALIVIDQFNYDAPKTSALHALVSRLGFADQKVLILTAGIKANVFLSGRNLPKVHVMPYSDVSTYHILWSDVVLVEAEALGEQLETVPEVEHHPAKKTSPKTAKNVPAPKPAASAKKKVAERVAAPKAKKPARVEAKSKPAKASKPASPKAKAASNKKASSTSKKSKKRS